MSCFKCKNKIVKITQSGRSTFFVLNVKNKNINNISFFFWCHTILYALKFINGLEDIVIQKNGVCEDSLIFLIRLMVDMSQSKLMVIMKRKKLLNFTKMILPNLGWKEKVSNFQQE